MGLGMGDPIPNKPSRNGSSFCSWRCWKLTEQCHCQLQDCQLWFEKRWKLLLKNPQLSFSLFYSKFLCSNALCHARLRAFRNWPRLSGALRWGDGKGGPNPRFSSVVELVASRNSTSQAKTSFIWPPAGPRHQPLQLLAQSEPLGRHVRRYLGNRRLT